MRRAAKRDMAGIPMCEVCSKPCSALGKRYCSQECVGRSSNKGHAVACGHCSKEFNCPPSAGRKFCTYQCFIASGGATRAGLASAEAIMKKYGAKKDANHNELMAVLKQFCAVHDLSNAGYGIPDGLIYVEGQWHLFDIKNPKTSYGRRGLNNRQKAWVSDWRGGPIYLIYNTDEAQLLAKGKFEQLKRVDPGQEMLV